MEPKILIFDKECIIKSKFHKHERPISIDKVENYQKKIYMVMKVHLNTLLDI